MIFKTISTVLFSALLMVGTLQGCSSDSKTDDATITQNVQSKIANEPSVASQNILVETRDGVVILTGTVDDKTQETTIITLSQSVDGVKNVDSKIIVKPALLTAPKPLPQAAPQTQQPATPPAPDTNVPQPEQPTVPPQKPEQPTVPPQTPEQPVAPIQPQTPNVIGPSPQADTQTGMEAPATTDAQKQSTETTQTQPQPQSTTY